MRRLFTVPKLLILFSSFLLLPLISCGEDSGLGASIDTKSPVLSIEYPESGVAIRDSFILAGTCSDDKKIAKITVTVRSLDKDEDDKGFVDDSFLADMALDELSWSITLNEYDDSNPNYFNGWKYADGKYEVGVTAFDNAGNNSGTYSRTFEIDNNPPVFVISNPGVVKGSGLTPSAYGSIFTIDGTISDNHTVSFMDVKIFDVNGECVSSETYDGESLPFFREEDIATAGGTSVQIAQFGSSQNQRYATIHPEDHGTEYYYAQITLTDNTKAYKNPPKSSARTAEELESDSCGNSSSKVYLYDSVYKTLMSSRNGMGLSAANLKDILAGLETNDEALAILNENIIDTAAGSDDDTMAGKLSFSLNPESNPVYNVNGFGLHFGNGTDQTASCGNTVSVTVTAGLDGTNVAPDSVKLWIKHLNEKPSDPAALKEDLKKLQVEVTKLENNEYDFIVEADKSADNKTTTIHTDDAGDDWLLIYDYFQGNDRKKSSSVSTKTFSVMLPTEGISLGAYYIFGVTGYDAEDVVFAQDTVYGFVGNAAGVPPTITFVSPENLAVMNEFSTFTGTASVASADYYVAAVKADFTVTDAGTNEIIGEFSDEITSKKNSSGQLVWQPSDIGIGALSWSGEDTWSFDPSKIQDLMDLYDAKVKVSDTNDGAYWLCTLKITGVSSSSHDSFSTGSIHIDTVSPVVSIASITPTVSGGEYFGAGDENTYLNGKIAIRGNVVENQNLKEGEDAVTYDIWASTDLTKELTQEDSILSGLIEHKDEYGVEFDGKLGRAYAISLADFPTTVITKYFDDYKGSDGDQKIQIELIFTAEDKAGNKGSYSSKALNGGKNFVIYQETDRPKIVLENVSSDVKTASAISTEQNLFGTKSNNKMSVTFSDDDTVNTVVVTLYDKDGNKISDESSYYGINPYSMNPKKSSYALRYVLPEKEGVYKVSIAAMDGNYIETDVSDADSMNKNVLQDFFIAVDSGAPNVIIDTPSGFKTDGFEIRGSITPSSKVFGADKCSIKAVFIDENENELSVQPGEVKFPALNGNIWASTVNFASSAVSGKYTILFTVTDEYNQSNSAKFAFNIDANAPEISENSADSTVYLDEAQYVQVSAKVTDDYSGVSFAGYYLSTAATAPDNIDAVQWTQMNQGANNVWNGTLSIQEYALANKCYDETVYVFYSARDNAGNSIILDGKTKISLDKQIPVLKIKKIADNGELSEGETLLTNDKNKTLYAEIYDTNIESLTAVTDSDTESEKIITVGTGTDIVSAGNTVGKKFPVTVNPWKDNTGYIEDSYDISFTAKDKNGRTAKKTVTLFCDNKAPEGKHEFDAKGKDIYFRLGDSANGSFEDVGGKYSPGTYGNASTILIRGNFEESSQGSGISFIYYLLSKEEPTSDVINAFLADYANKKTGYFSILSTPETKKVSYNNTADGSDSENRDVLSNFKTNITGFEEGNNYLVLLVVDKAGNAKIDTVAGERYYSINVDTGTPIFEKEPEVILTNATQDITIEGFVTDKEAGIDNVALSVTVNDKTSYATVESEEAPGSENDKNRIEWTATISKSAFEEVDSGTYTVYATATDRAGSGNKQTVSVANITVDKISPSVEVVKPADADTSTGDIEINGTINLDGTISDGNMLPETAILAVEYSSDYTENSADSASWTALPVYSAENENGIKLSGNYTFKAENFVTTTLEDESYYYLRAKAIDKAGNIGYSTPFKVKISQDSDRPIVKITNLTYLAEDSENPYVLKFGTKSQIIALVSDDDGIESVQFSDEKITEKAADLPNSVLSNGTVTFTPRADYDANKNIDAKKTVYVYIKDSAGKEYYTTYKTDKNAENYLNVPKIRVNEHELQNEDCAKVFTYRSDSTAPKVEDLKSQAYEADGITLSGSEETVSASYILGGSAKPNAKFIVTASDESQIAGIALEITYISKSGSEVTEKYRSGDKVADSSYTVNGEISESAENSKKSVWTTGVISFADAATGSVKVNVIPYDKLGLVGNGNFSFYADNSAPEIKFKSPQAGDEVTGSVTISGSAEDQGNAGTETIYWIVPTLDQTTALNGKSDSDKLEYLRSLSWNGGIDSLAAGSSARAWEFNFDGKFAAETSDTDNFVFVAGNPLFEVYDSTDFATEIQDGIYTLPLYFLAIDKLGNTSWETGYYIKHNPDADRPKLEFTYPTKDNYVSSDEKYAVLGGTIRATGSATIPSATTTVKAIYYQIADENAEFSDSDKVNASQKYTVVSAYEVLNEIVGTNYNSSSILSEEQLKKYGFVSNEEFQNWWGIKASGTGSWGIILNANGELNPSSGTTNITIRASGVNAEGKFGAWTSGDNVIAIHIDNTAPVINARVNQYGNGNSRITSLPSEIYTSSQNYESDLYLRGHWTLVATLLDETSVTNYSVLKGGALLSAESDYYVETGISESGKNGVQLYIPIPKDSSNVELTVNAQDAEHTASQTFSFNIDETAPSLDSLKGNGTDFTSDDFESIEDSNYQFIVSGSSTDEGSGLKHILFYYMRKAGKTQDSIAENVVMDPMITSGTEDSKIAMSSLTERKFTQGNETFSLYAYAYSGTATTDTFTADSSYDAHIRVGGLVEIDGILHRISEINGNTLTFTPSLAAAKTDSFNAYFPIAQVIDNSATEKVKSYSANPFTFDKGDDDDKMPESFSKSGKTWTWDATIHSTNMPDGPASLVILAFDNAGNVAGKTINTKITNNAPRLAKVFFGTDLSGDGNYVNSESLTEIEEYDILGAEGITQATYTLDFTEMADGKAKYPKGIFTIKNGLAVIPELTGGNGDIGMILKTDATDASAVSGSVMAATSSATVSGTGNNLTSTFTGKVAGTFKGSEAEDKMHSFVLSSDKLGNDGSDKGMSFTFWDKTEETVQGSTSQKAVLFVKNFKVAQNDSTPPTVVVNPFYWNSAADNSLYANSRENGHIELESDWTAVDGEGNRLTSWDENSSALDSDPKVSGKITFTGTAYDDARLASITVQFGTFLASATEVATYSESESKWNTMETNGLEFTVTDVTSSAVGNYDDSVYFSQKGHKVYWTLSIDTAKITNQVGSDVVLTVLAKDAKNNTTAASSITAPVTTSGYTVIDGTTNKPTYQMDVVPYITGVTTTLSNLKKNNPSVYNRTARGHYPVAADETITFSGFNLGDNTTLEASTLTASGAYNFAVTYTVAENEDVTVYALNNLNDNDAKGVYDKTVDLDSSPTGSKSIYDNYYNRCPNGDNNNLLTDDVWFDVWEIDSTAVKPKVGAITQPVMAIDPAHDNIGFAFINGTAYFSMPYGTNSKSVTPNSYEYWIGGLDEWNSVSLTYDINGYTYATAAGGDLNTSKNGVDIFRFTTSRWDGKGTLSTKGYEDLNNQFGLEYIGEREYFYDESQSKWADFTNFSKSRIKSPSLATVASSTDTSQATVYLAYYDSINDEIRFNWGIIKDTKNNSKTGMFDTHYGTERSSKAYSISGTSLIAGQTIDKAISTTPTYASKPVTTEAGVAVYGGEYVSIAAIPDGGDSDDAVVAVWWDGTNHKMLYSYNKKPKSIALGEYTQEQTEWSAPEELFPQEVGEYCKVTVDASSGVHIAAYDSTNGDIWYAYLKNYDEPSSAKTGYLDSNGFVGSELDIDVALVNNEPVPCVSYYASNAAKPKIARWVGGDLSQVESVSGSVDDAFTSNWDISYIPTSSKLIVDHINVAVWKNKDGTLKSSVTGAKNFQAGSGATVNSYGTVWGNGTENPVLGYATKSGSLGYIETAQMK